MGEILTKSLPQKELRPLIEKVRARIKKDPIVKRMFEEYDVDVSEIDLIPMCFADLDVSARTDHGIIYFSTKLLEDGDFDDDDHYLVHEITHFLQQTTGNKPTQGSDEGDYLENPDEIEGFQNQTEYIAKNKGPEEAENYVERVLDHHDLKGKKREDRREALLAIANSSTVNRREMLFALASKEPLNPEALSQIKAWYQTKPAKSFSDSEIASIKDPIINADVTFILGKRTRQPMGIAQPHLKSAKVLIPYSDLLSDILKDAAVGYRIAIQRYKRLARHQMESPQKEGEKLAEKWFAELKERIAKLKLADVEKQRLSRNLPGPERPYGEYLANTETIADRVEKLTIEADEKIKRQLTENPSKVMDVAYNYFGALVSRHLLELGKSPVDPKGTWPSRRTKRSKPPSLPPPDEDKSDWRKGLTQLQLKRNPQEWEEYSQKINKEKPLPPIGEKVKILEGKYRGSFGPVQEINPNNREIKVLVSLLGTEISVTVDANDVETMTETIKPDIPSAPIEIPVIPSKSKSPRVPFGGNVEGAGPDGIGLGWFREGK